MKAKSRFWISDIYFLPGYHKSKEAYRNNNRIKKVRFDVFSGSGKVVSSEVIELPDVPYDEINYSDFYKQLVSVFYCSYEYADFDYDKNGKIRITILDVYKGDKYDDTCVFEIFVCGEYLRD